MTDKEMNLEIYNQMLAHCRKAFDECLKINQTQIRLSELVNSEYEFKKKTEIVTIQVGSFKCSFDPGCFWMLQELKKSVGIKDNPLFTKSEADKGSKRKSSETVCSFDIDAKTEKVAKTVLSKRSKTYPVRFSISGNIFTLFFAPDKFIEINIPIHWTGEEVNILGYFDGNKAKLPEGSYTIEREFYGDRYYYSMYHNGVRFADDVRQVKSGMINHGANIDLFDINKLKANKVSLYDSISFHCANGAVSFQSQTETKEIGRLFIDRNIDLTLSFSGEDLCKFLSAGAISVGLSMYGAAPLVCLRTKNGHCIYSSILDSVMDSVKIIYSDLLSEIKESETIQAIEAAQPEPIEATQPDPIKAAQVASRAYDVAEKSPMEAAEWPWQLRILLSILHNFGLIKSPLRYAVSLQLEACMKAILPTATPTETLLQAIRPAFGTRFGSPIPTLCGFDGIKTHKNGRKNFEKTGTNGLRGGGTMILEGPGAVAMIGIRGAVSMTGGRGGVAMTGGRGGVSAVGGRGGVAMAGGRGAVAAVGCHGAVAMTGGRGAVAASMRRAAAAMSHAAGVSLLLPYALWDLSPITRPTGVSPPGKAQPCNSEF